MPNINDFVELNLKGSRLEKEGQINEAIDIYEDVISQDFIGNHPYDRLAIIYRKRKDYKNEIRVLNKAIHIFQNKVYIKRKDRKPKLDRFNKRLIRAKELMNQSNE